MEKYTDVYSSLKRFQHSKENFSLTMSNYSAKFSVNDKVVKKFNKNKINPYVFGIANKIKSEINYYEENNTLPYFDRDRLPYYSYNKELFIQNNSFDRVSNIDLRNCYSRVLFMEGIISEKTYGKLINVSKNNRLVSVGFLAYEPHYFLFDKGELINYEIIKNNYAKYFYYCVNICGRIIAELRHIAGDNFIFSWVDGIYIIPDRNIENKIINYLRKINYDYSVTKLINFRITNKINNCNVEFEREFKEGKKIFNIPIADNKEEFNKNYIINSILKNNNHEHKRLNQISNKWR